MDIPGAPSLTSLFEQIATLREASPVEARAGHCDLGSDLWLSTDPSGEGVLAFESEPDGFRLILEQGDSGRWAALGMRLPCDKLESSRYVGLLIETNSDALVSFTPQLRYRLHDGRLTDVGPPLPVVLPRGIQTYLTHLPIDTALLAQTRECELNLFFHTDRMSIQVTKLEPLLLS